MRSVATLLLSIPHHFLVPWGYVVVFIASILEAMPILGSFIPGHSIVILGGFFSKLHYLRLWRVIILATLGAFIGDSISYILGKKYGYSFIKKYGKYISFKNKHYTRLKSLVLKHTGKTLIISRFNPFSRAFAPFIAGASKVKSYSFFVYAFMGAVSWASISVLLGYIFGASYEVAAQYMGKFVAIASVLVVLFIYVYHVINKKGNIFSKYYLHVLSLCIVMLYIAAKICEDVITKDSYIIKADIWTSVNISSLWTPGWTVIMKLINFIFTPYSMIAAILFITIILLYKKEWNKAILVVLTTATASGTDIFIESIMQRARPDMSLIHASGYSFPSSSILFSTLVISLIIYLYKDKIKDEANRAIFISLSLGLIALLGFSKIYLNIQWLSDVIAGISISVFWITFWILFMRFAKNIKSAIRNFSEEYASYSLAIEHIPY